MNANEDDILEEDEGDEEEAELVEQPWFSPPLRDTITVPHTIAVGGFKYTLDLTVICKKSELRVGFGSWDTSKNHDVL